MKVEILQAMNEKRSEKDVNEFIENSQIKVLGLQFAATMFCFSVMISYEDILLTHTNLFKLSGLENHLNCV